ncbi:MAG: hypothetical protein ACR2F9_08175, partial [Longimicrobiaceae bacterium]
MCRTTATRLDWSLAPGRLAALPLLLAGCTAMPPSAGSPSSAGLPDAAAVALPGASLALARERAASISNVRYDLSLDVTARDSARGGWSCASSASRAPATCWWTSAALCWTAYPRTVPHSTTTCGATGT